MRTPDLHEHVCKKRAMNHHAGDYARLRHTMNPKHCKGDYARMTTAVTAASSRPVPQTGPGDYALRMQKSEQPRHPSILCCAT